MNDVKPRQKQCPQPNIGDMELLAMTLASTTGAEDGLFFITIENNSPFS